MLGPVSRRVVGCTCLFLPPRRRPSPSPAGGSASRNDPLRDFTAAGISRSSPFLTFRPPGLFATQVSPTAAARKPQGSRDFYARAEHAPLPLRASGMLAVRTRQLTAEDFHLLDLQPCRPLPGLAPAGTTDLSRHTWTATPVRFTPPGPRPPLLPAIDREGRHSNQFAVVGGGQF